MGPMVIIVSYEGSHIQYYFVLRDSYWLPSAIIELHGTNFYNIINFVELD